jgi:hypothetical protein
LQAPLTRARGSRQLDTLELLKTFAEQRQRATRREGRGLSFETRAALGGSFLRALLHGVVDSCAAAKPRPRRVLITGAVLASPPAAAALAAALGHRQIDALLPEHGAVLDGALAYGAAEHAGTLLT